MQVFMHMMFIVLHWKAPGFIKLPGHFLCWATSLPGKEQMVQAQHTQNIKPNFNAGFDYRLINAPGFFVNQNNNHNNVRLFANYQGKRKRYNSFLVLLNNTIRASENGGIVNDSFLLSPNYKDRFGIDVNLGNNNGFTQNPLSTTVLLGIFTRNLVFFCGRVTT